MDGKTTTYTVIKNHSVTSFINSEEIKNPCIVLHEISIVGEDIKNEIRCRNWIFLERINISNCNFYLNVDLTLCHFYKNVFFLASYFSNKVSFDSCNFYSDSKFVNSQFMQQTRFLNCVFTSITSFHGVVFNETTNFNNSQFNGLTDFIEVAFRAEAYINFKSFLDKNNKPRSLILNTKNKPIHFGTVRKEATKDNFHSLKKVFHNNEQYDDEDEAYYWFKVHERKCETNIIKRFFSWFILDIGTKYFTAPLRVAGSMFLLFFVSFLFFSVVNYFEVDNLGYLSISNPNNPILFTLEVEGDLITTSDYNNMIKIKDICFENGNFNYGKFLRYNAYFSLITFTTIGYGDIQPAEKLQIFAGLEGFIGVMLMSLFLVTLAKKILW